MLIFFCLSFKGFLHLLTAVRCTAFTDFLWVNCKRLGLTALLRGLLRREVLEGKLLTPLPPFQTNLSPTLLPPPPPHLPPLPSCPPAPPPPLPTLLLLSPIPFFVISLGEFPADSVCHGNQPVVVTGPAAHTSCVCGCMCVCVCVAHKTTDTVSAKSSRTSECLSGSCPNMTVMHSAVLSGYHVFKQ